jgi:hypothetical protein
MDQTHRKCANPDCSKLVIIRSRFRHCRDCTSKGLRAPGGNQYTTGAAVPKNAGAEGTAPGVLTDSVVERGDERNIIVGTKEHVRTLEDLIRVCEIDTETWDIVEWHANKWEMGWKDALDEAHALPLFQVKARLRRKIHLVAAKQEIEALKVLAKESIDKPIRKSVTFKIDNDNLLEVDIFDLHLGKLSWAKETGYQNYDLKIARALFEEALEILIARTSSHKFAQVVLPIGNDFFHSDNLANETTAGTRQDMDGRFHKTAHIGREMMVYAIERLREIAPVTAIVAPGNHDQLSAWHLGDSLECYFHRDGDVAVDNYPTLRKYHEFGKVMLMFTHGNRGKQQDYPLLMATEQPDMWGRTRFREAHLGHLHKTQLRDSLTVGENHGARVRIISSLCAADAWHAEMTFVGNLRQAEAFVWNKREGQIAHATYTAP